MNAIARASGIKLTGGNAHGISEEMLHKILSPSDDSRPPSVLMLLAYYKATNNPAHLRAMLRAVGLDIMTTEDRLYAEIGRHSVTAKKKNAEAQKARRLMKELEEEL
ncbi:hypothetical protein [uncultured Desulfovibrio sp.]|uniref:hypothetical protein n=1 Tax=uncultured Desulfovibrio sp. TaxID=167968 RepID=UPI0026DBCB98|nr:hypothetical protein [uncultured Desulfovibrio sp.]